MCESCGCDGSQMEPSSRTELRSMVDYTDDGVVSRTLMDKEAGSVTLFAFDAGQSLSEHTTPYDALVQVIEGEVELSIGGEEVRAEAGELVLMPADVPHAVSAPQKFKMLLTMIRS
ncbi:MAG: cupin domain-containing protein [Planctomycetota bacterium]